MNATHLVSAEGNSFSRWMCSACESLWGEREAALACCTGNFCLECRRALFSTAQRCSECEEDDFDALQNALFSLATPVAYCDYEQPFLFWAYPDGGKYFSTKTALERFCLETGKTLPRWVWACKPSAFKLQADAVLEAANDTVLHFVDTEDLTALQAALDLWTAQQPIQTYDIDYTFAVILDSTLLTKKERIERDIEDVEG